MSDSEPTFEISDISTSKNDRKEAEQQPWTHPLDSDGVKSFLEQNVSSDLAQELANAIRPILNPNPTEQELEEAERVKMRRNQHTGENPGTWATRTMYEETFAVNPLTIGGILSHTNEQQKIDGEVVTGESMLAKLSALDIKCDTGVDKDILDQLGQAFKDGKIAAVPTFNLLGNIIDLGRFTNSPGGISRLPFHRAAHYAASPASMLQGQHQSYIRSGLHVIQAEELYGSLLSSPVEDPRIIAAIPDVEGQTRRTAMRTIWHNLYGLNGPVITAEGTYKAPGSDRFAEGLTKLATVRSSPDFAFLYDRFSVTGSLQRPRQ